MNVSNGSRRKYQYLSAMGVNPTAGEFVPVPFLPGQPLYNPFTFSHCPGGYVHPETLAHEFSFTGPFPLPPGMAYDERFEKADLLAPTTTLQQTLEAFEKDTARLECYCKQLQAKTEESSFYASYSSYSPASSTSNRKWADEAKLLPPSVNGSRGAKWLMGVLVLQARTLTGILEACSQAGFGGGWARTLSWSLRAKVA
ncbi:hypothetical protein MBLNU230_g1920t1 [Neophaeotheca triangularis]